MTHDMIWMSPNLAILLNPSQNGCVWDAYRKGTMMLYEKNKKGEGRIDKTREKGKQVNRE